MDLSDWLWAGLVSFYCLLHCIAVQPALLSTEAEGGRGEIRAGCYYCILPFILEWHPIDWLLFNIINLSPSIIHNLLLASTASEWEILNYLHSGLTNVFCCNNVTKIPLIGHHKSSKYSNCRLWSFFKIVQIKYCLSWELQSYTHFGAKNAGIEIWRDFCVFFLCWWHSLAGEVRLWRSEITVGNIGELGGGGGQQREETKLDWISGDSSCCWLCESAQYSPTTQYNSTEAGLLVSFSLCKCRMKIQFGLLGVKL